MKHRNHWPPCVGLRKAQPNLRGLTGAADGGNRQAARPWIVDPTPVDAANQSAWKARRMRSLGLLALMLLLPFVMAGCATPSKAALDAEVKRLCAIDGGIEVYETVRLPAEKFDKYGKPNFLIKNRDQAKPEDEYFYQWHIQYYQQQGPVLTRSEYKIIRGSDGKILGRSVRYARGGGDLPGPWHDSSFICPPISKDQPELEASIFLKKEN